MSRSASSPLDSRELAIMSMRYSWRTFLESKISIEVCEICATMIVVIKPDMLTYVLHSNPHNRCEPFPKCFQGN